MIHLKVGDKMTYKETMFDSLNNLLEDNEELMYPIIGTLNMGNAQYYGYFGFTEKYLLIALVSAMGKITYTTRVPLDIKSIKIKQTSILKEYIIDITFNEMTPCRITASPKVLTIDTQKENLPAFLEHLQTIAPKTKQPELAQLSGEKIRIQYFNYAIFVYISFFPTMPIMWSVLEWKESGKLPFDEVISAFLENLLATALLWGIVLIPLVLLSLLNWFCFGKVICVLDDKGVYVESDLLLWKDIKSISFQPATIPSKYFYSPNCATFTIRKAQEYKIDVIPFSFFALRKIKRYCPDVKIEVKDKGTIIFYALSPTIGAIVFSLLS